MSYLKGLLLVVAKTVIAFSYIAVATMPDTVTHFLSLRRTGIGISFMTI